MAAPVRVHSGPMSTAPALDMPSIPTAPPTANSERDPRWLALLARDAAADGRFVYAVRTTGVYCRPSCPSRRPLARSVTFFSDPASAEVAGFRACRRCRPRESAPAPAGLDAVRDACAFIRAQEGTSVSLDRLAARAGLSRAHFQRTFTRLVGLSPRAYQQALRAGRFRRELREGEPVASALNGAGYGSSSRVYEAPPTGGMTPARYRRGGEGLQLRYTTAATPLGRLLVAGTVRGICAVKLGADDRALIRELRDEFPKAEVVEMPGPLARWTRALVAHLEGRRPHLQLPLDVQGTAFQWRVWQELQRIPYGETRSYADIATAIGRPTAARAVARACATNPACLVVPCHRVVGKDGRPSGYRWGVSRKRALLEAERR